LSRREPYLRERGYQAVSADGGVSAWPLNSVSERYDRTALLNHVQEFGERLKTPGRLVE